MEDDMSTYVDDKAKAMYAAVFDGHGGPEASNWLAKELLPNSLSSMLRSKPNGDVKQMLTQTFEQGDKTLMVHLEKLGKEVLSNAGSTGTVVVVQHNGTVTVANVGDSQAFLMRKGQALALTTPHKVYGSGPEVRSETARVKATGAWIHDGRVCNILAVSRAFGDWEFKGAGLKQLLSAGVQREYWPQEFADKQKIVSDPVIATPSVSQWELGPDDEVLVLATDGLWDVLPPIEALKLAKNKLKEGKTAEEAAQFLVGIALKRYTSDNVACIVLDFIGAEQRAEDSASSDNENGGGSGGIFGKISGLFGKKGK